MIQTRAADPEERVFITKSWLDEYRRVPSSGTIPAHLFAKLYVPVVHHVLDNPDVTTLVACHSSAPSVVLGFIVTESGFTRPVLHFLFVKPDYRGNGIAKALLAAANLNPKEPFFYTYETEFTGKHLRAGDRWLGTYGRHVVVVKKDVNRDSLGSKRAIRARRFTERAHGRQEGR